MSPLVRSLITSLSFIFLSFRAFSEAAAQEIDLRRLTQAAQPVNPLSPAEEGRIKVATDLGVAFLKSAQLPSGTWAEGPIVVNSNAGFGPKFSNWPIAYAALPALALLESGVDRNDPSVSAAIKFVRAHVGAATKTYEIGLVILLLDRVGAAEDVKSIETLALRLAAGQSSLGGWAYNCPLLDAKAEKDIRQTLNAASEAIAQQEKRVKATPIDRAKLPKEPRADHSNTQFALLGLIAARKHKVQVDPCLLSTENRFRSSLLPNGWGYGLSMSGTGAMTCSGLLGVAGGYLAEMNDKEAKIEAVEDRLLQESLSILSTHMRHPTDLAWPESLPYGKKGAINPYFLWSVQRVGVFTRLQTIGGIDWYRWGVSTLLPTQNRNGSWLGRGTGSPVADTSFALLFLRKSDPLPDLRKELAKRVKIVDPGPAELKAGIAKEGKADPKKAIPKPKDEKPPSSAQEGPPSASLGKVQVGQATELPLKVRGPEAFRILKVEGADGAVKVDFDKKSREVHELAVTVKGAEPGELRRTLTLITDLPDLREVEIRVIVRVEGAKSP